MDVSIIIPTRDSATVLARCLASIERTTDVEIVVVDQESVDETRAIAQSYGATLVEAERPAVYTPPARSRNAGASLARGDHLLHLDADMTLQPGALEAAVSLCRDGGHVAVILEEVDAGDGFWATCKELERRCYRGSRLLEGARFVRSDTFRTVGGYDESLGSGEDWDVHSRYAAEGTIARLPNAVVHHLGAVSPRRQMRKKFAYGRSTAAFLAKHGGSGHSAEMLHAYARSWRLFARDPAHTAGLAVLRGCEVAALVAGLAAERLERRR